MEEEEQTWTASCNGPFVLPNRATEKKLTNQSAADEMKIHHPEHVFSFFFSFFKKNVFFSVSTTRIALAKKCNCH